MKRNKLVLTSGILMVIMATYAIIGAMVLISSLVELIFGYPYVIMDEMYLTNFYTLELIVTHGVGIVAYILQAIGFMIVGIKLIKKSNGKYLYSQRKTLLIVGLVFACVSIIMDFMGLAFGLLVAIIVLTSCALGSSNPYAEISTTNQVENKVVEEKDIPQSQNPDDIMLDRLMKLQELKDNGVISEEEYIQMIDKTMRKDVKKDDKK